ncbi:hypothetical protein [Luteibacter sp. dw_328]|uniref:hypothetical protein n=1 Tax=Luteibacter sp. dw_328 TaxID=2719796 RepID=UPI001BD4EF60|nr:hypothetical protein [Luteibacter sp. dw_328]
MSLTPSDFAFGSSRVGFQIAELSTALVEYFNRSFTEVQAKAKADTLTPQAFAAAQASLYGECVELAHMFSDRFNGTVDLEWAKICDAWAQGFDAKRLVAQAAVETEDKALEYFKNFVSSASIYDDEAVLSSQIGKGVGPVEGSPLSLNRYAYADDNPIANNDPTGAESCGVWACETYD